MLVYGCMGVVVNVYSVVWASIVSCTTIREVVRFFVFVLLFVSVLLGVGKPR